MEEGADSEDAADGDEAMTRKDSTDHEGPDGAPRPVLGFEGF